MTVVAKFNGTTGYAESTTGVDISATAQTWGMLINPNAVSAFMVPCGIWQTTTDVSQVYINGSTILGLGQAGAGAEDGGVSFSANSWYLIFISKAAGSATPRASTYNGTTWHHADMDGPIGNISGTIDRIAIGANRNNGVTASPFNGEVAWVGLWAETTADATAETYTDHTLVAAKANVQFFTGTSLIDAGTFVDSSSHANNETGRTGVTVGSHAIPSWYTNFGVPASGGGPTGSMFVLPGVNGPLVMGWPGGFSVDPPPLLDTGPFPPWPPPNTTLWGM